MLPRLLRSVVKTNNFSYSIIKRTIFATSMNKANFLVKINQQNETFELHDTEVGNLESGKQKKFVFEFPFVYLRDNCQCDKCFHQHSKSRTINWEKFDISIKPKQFNFDSNQQILNVIWDDKENHKSAFHTDWLYERNFSTENHERIKNELYRPPKYHWTKEEFRDIVKYFDYESVLKNEQDMFDWLHALSVYGITFLTNVPSNKSEMKRLANHIGFIQRTHYGELFDIAAKDDTSNVAYLSSNLQLHCDLPYYKHIPSLTFLHCLTQTLSSGAQNLIVDAVGVAKTMKKSHPAEFEALSTILVNWNDEGKEETGPAFHAMLRAPVICLDYEGEIERINHSIPQRDSFFTLPVDDVKCWYRALAKFIELMYESAVKFKTEEGTILCFDNVRLLHGRKKYDDTVGNKRLVVGCYFDWDQIYSRYRVLKKKLERI